MMWLLSIELTKPVIMRKLSIAFMGIFLFHLSSQAQTDSAVASAKYTLTHIMDTTQPDNPLVSKMVLYIGKNMSNYTYDRTNTPSGNINTLGVLRSATVDGVSMGGAPPPPPPGLSAMSTLGNYYKDLNASLLSFMTYAGGKVFAVQEQIPVIEWNITEETKEIMGLQCQKAIGDFKGRTYHAWFSSQLPYSNGPWKLGGLPGLIIEASDTKKEVIFQLTSFENATGPQIKIGLPNDIVKATFKEFKQYLDAIENDRQATAGSTGGMVVSGRITGGTFAGTGPGGMPVKPRKLNNPIEKEVKK
jgi:GLPGLI family protein